MKSITVTINEPKTRKSAIAQYIQLDQQIHQKKKRKENIMSNIKSAQERLEKLNKTLEEYQKQIEFLDRTSDEFQGLLEGLKLKFNLTEAEILEAKSSLLRSQIAELEAQAGFTRKGEKLV